VVGAIIYLFFSFLASFSYCVVPILFKIIVHIVLFNPWQGKVIRFFFLYIDKYLFLGNLFVVKRGIDANNRIVLQDYSKGIRLEELNVLLKQTVMVGILNILFYAKSRLCCYLFFTKQHLVPYNSASLVDSFCKQGRSFSITISTQDIFPLHSSCSNLVVYF